MANVSHRFSHPSPRSIHTRKDDDGFAPWLIAGADFDNDFPIIAPLPPSVPAPRDIVPFIKRREVPFSMKSTTFLHFYSNDYTFRGITRRIEWYAEEARDFGGMLSPDFSIDVNAKDPVARANVYRSRAVGSYMQRLGIPVIPSLRWGRENTFEYAFRGITKHSMVAISTVGSLKNPRIKSVFHQGLLAMLAALEPSTVLVNGEMPLDIFGDLLEEHPDMFRSFPSWTHRAMEATHGHR
ncbi:DUF4417 domain-containing protein [Pseudoscardovia radai]|uniref:DUF4417 domain-containing protein n=1 Tax=Pseudoscardovia radai TaxID=987066 RepID=UPI003995AEAD